MQGGAYDEGGASPECLQVDMIVAMGGRL